MIRRKKEEDTSPITLLEEIFPGDTNPYGTAFGGKILALMDRAAGLAASRFAHCHFVTASVNAIEFRAPVRQGEIAEVTSRVVYTSSHTCGVKVEVFAVDKTAWERKRCCEGLIFMVALGPKGALRTIPRLTPRTAEEKRAWAEAERIHRQMTRGRKGRR